VFTRYHRIWILVKFCLAFYCTANAQTPTIQDCLGALPVCQNVYSETRAPSGEGNYTNEIFTGSICLNDGETNSIWYTFTVNKTGDFGFLITPADLDDDYDWALFNITNASCGDIISDPNIMVSCNAAGDQGCHGPTGATGGSNSNFQGFNCYDGNSPENALVPVEIGNTYALMINNWTGSVNGYTLDFALAGDITVVDNLAPTVNNITAQGTQSFTIQFSENIQCSSIDSENFEIIGDGGPYEIQLTESPCVFGAQYAQQFTFSISPPLKNGVYTIQMQPNDNFMVVDVCDNPAMPAEEEVTINFCAKTTSLNCDDGLACTENDVMLVDVDNNSVVCTPCAGLATGGCETGMTTAQTCNDDDPSTENDIEIVLSCDNTVCEPCEGTPVCNDLIEESISICPGDSARLLDGTYTTIPDDYSFTFINQAGCDSIIIERVIQSPDVEITIADTIYATINEPLLLSATTNATNPAYFWYPPNFLSCFTCATPMVNTQQTGFQQITLQLTDMNTGCLNEVSFSVKISLSNKIFMPNAFSPNQDGQNDELSVRFQGEVLQFDIKIYNRWGNPVYSGVYAYFAKATYVNNEQVIKKGSITLIR